MGEIGQKLTEHVLKKYLNYDLDTGKFTRKISIGYRNRWGEGTEAGSITEGKIVLTIEGLQYPAHSCAWLSVYGEWVNMLDHIDTDFTNNKISNLRKSTKRTNGYNRPAQKNNSCGFKNVTLRKDTGKYSVTLKLEGKKKSFGSYEDLELANLVAIEARNKYHKEFANHS